MKYFIEISYKGTAYHGWQIQNNAHSVQQEINDCISKILGKPIMVQGSGRTDTGVHCLQQFAHFESQNKVLAKPFLKAINAVLPTDISIQQLYKVKEDAHARFSALSRKYIYKITHKKSPFLTDYAYLYHKELDISSMQKAADLLLKWQDYTAFSKTNSNNKNNLCAISEAYFEEQKDMLLFHIKANRFLRGMVRIIMGALMHVGANKITVAEFKVMLQSKNITGKRYAVPAHGLYLAKVEYPADIFIQD